jgi:hypothetical protein
MVKGTVKAGRQDYYVHTRVDGPYEVGDFGLATSSLAAAVEPSELAPNTITADAEMTLGLCPIFAFWTLLIIVHRGWDQTVHCTGSAVAQKRPAKPYQGGFV